MSQQHSRGAMDLRFHRWQERHSPLEVRFTVGYRVLGDDPNQQIWFSRRVQSSGIDGSLIISESFLSRFWVDAGS